MGGVLKVIESSFVDIFHATVDTNFEYPYDLSIVGSKKKINLIYGTMVHMTNKTLLCCTKWERFGNYA